MESIKIHIKGVVQGVGFRPFIYNLAKEMKLMGWVRNTTSGVEIHVDGDNETLTEFVKQVQEKAPPLSSIDDIKFSNEIPNGFDSFQILKSENIRDAFQPISPDICICDQCLEELFDSTNRRFKYPFINCTNCGPRFTIIKDMPYDRPNTTMANFEMCPECKTEYNDPTNRRFHAQPIACANCGPNIWYENLSGDIVSGNDAIYRAIVRIFDGDIIAIKGLGGFHLACDPFDNKVVQKIRQRKSRFGKPFALMFPDIDTARRHCELSSDEVDLLISKERPIVLVNKISSSTIAENVAPNQNTFGIMLPYTPLHYLLFSKNKLRDKQPEALVMTSGNISDEPIVKSNQEAKEKLINIADGFIFHNRPIYTNCDDSVVWLNSSQKIQDISTRETHSKQIIPVRRSRGYAPFPLTINWKTVPILACGGELKNTFCLTREHYAFLSHHIGDLDNYETYHSYEKSIDLYEHLHHIEPQGVAYDLHPDYMATRYAIERSERENLENIGIQHHHAHIVSCMAENNIPIDKPVIGIAFDGTGYGTDGSIWGGEILICTYKDFERKAHLCEIPLPGGDKAIKEPWRIALSWLHRLGVDWDESIPPIAHLFKNEFMIKGFQHQLNTQLNSPITTSMGRLFDAVASMIGIRQSVDYEAQAAIELEAEIDPGETQSYLFDIYKEPDSPNVYVFDPSKVILDLLQDYHQGISISRISTRFHNAITIMIVEICRMVRDSKNINTIALSGGVWQNRYLLKNTTDKLINAGFDVLIHNKVPTNDGGLAFGQAMIASQIILTR